GIFKVYSAHVSPISGVARVEQTRSESADPPLKMGKEVPMVPADSAFDEAASWAIHVPAVKSEGVANIFLQIEYEGDISRLYADGKLLTDNFYNGSSWLVALNGIPQQAWDRLELKILPLHNDAPIYLPKGARPAATASGQIAKLKTVRIVP